MSLNIYKVSEFETTHEREQFEHLSEILKAKFDKHEDVHLLISNPSFENRDIDAVFIKRDGITVIELKNYGGKLSIAENGDWKSNGITVKGGSNGKNPYMQVKLNKTGLCSVFNTWFYKPYVNLSHVSAVVLFNQTIEIESSSFSQNVSTWFHVTDMNGIANKLHNITSQSINYSNKDLLDLIDKLNLTECVEYKTDASIIEIEQEKVEALQTLETISIPQNLEEIKKNIENLGFKTIRHFPIPERPEITKNISLLNLSNPTRNFLNKKVQGNIWEHQFDSILLAKQNENVCLATSTSSGKSYVFYTVGIEKLAQTPNAKIIAIYPLKALGVQQEDNWNKALKDAGLTNIKVGRIDGSNSGQTDERKRILKECSVVVITPDTIHMFLLGKLNDNKIGYQIKEFLTKTELIILDEVHTYTGVFGSNSAYLYRRLNHIINILKGSFPQYIAASATINDPESHLRNIVGLDFCVVTNDTSPKKATDIILIEPNNFVETLSNMNKLVGYFAQDTSRKAITFLDSRKMVEQVAVSVNRQLNKDESDELLKDFEFGDDKRIYPYRSGYETKDSEDIQNKLMAGEVKSIISTSALEMGIDIKELDLCILLGIPYSSTSFYQRIGRVGRVGCDNDGLIIIVNDNTVRSNTIFKDPKRLFEIPMAEGALYLENENLQFIHALCWAEQNGEYDAVNSNTEKLTTKVEFPLSFLKVCKDIRNHNSKREYDEIRDKGGSYPQFSYPIRDLEPQFKVISTIQNREIPLGNLSRSQVQREAYPGAIYYYNTNSYRVYKVDLKVNTVFVRKEKKYFTKPNQLPTAVFPQLRDEKIFSGSKYGALTVIEVELQVYEKNTGLTEKRGGANLVKINYPLEGIYPDKVYYNHHDFSRDYRTTGTVLTHPVLDAPNVKSYIVAQLIYEIFLLNIPFEKQDISYAKNKFKDNDLGFIKDSRFIAIYDQSYGSLRLTSRLSEVEELKKVFDLACKLIKDSSSNFSFTENEEINQDTIDAIFLIKECLKEEAENLNFKGQNNVSVIKPSSEGLYNNKIVRISAVISTENGLKYKISVPIPNGSASKLVSINEIECTSQSEIGVFNYDTYEVE
jgi:DEAD/DEAH box helicase domain-containing protein